MNLVKELEAICELLGAGVLDADRIYLLLRTSIDESQQGRPSFHRMTGDPKCELRDEIVIQLAKLCRANRARNKDQIALQSAKRLLALGALYRNQLAQRAAIKGSSKAGRNEVNEEKKLPGRPKKEAEDEKLLSEYQKGMEQGIYQDKTDFADKIKRKRSTVRTILSRAEARRKTPKSR